MRFTYKFTALDFDLEAYRRYLNDYMLDWLKQAGREWLNATVLATPTLIPTWSRASRATFEKLARELGTSIPYGPLKSRKNRKPLGLASGSGSRLIIDPKGSRWHFRYENTLRYLAYNEYNVVVPGVAPNVFHGLIHPTPYRFQDKGRKAFEEFIRFTRLPNPLQRQFLRRVKVN